MSIRRFRILLLSALFIGILPHRVDGRSRYYVEHSTDSLSARLELVETAGDSLRLLVDILDLNPDSSDSIGKMILHTALVAGEDSIGLDIVRNLAKSHIRDASRLAADLNNAMRFSAGQDRDETATFVKMMQNVNKVRYSLPEERERRVRQLLRNISLGGDDNVYGNIVTLHAVCLYISEAAQGELLSKYMDRLGGLISKLRPEACDIRNCYLAQAALAYAENEEYGKSIACDKNLLRSLDEIEKGYKGHERPYRSYDGVRYDIYTRLLSNYPRLEVSEVEAIYSDVMELVANDSVAASVNRLTMRPQIYYAMFKKDYARALGMLKAYIDYPYNANYRRPLLKLMIRSAEAVGDIDALLTASREYNDILEQKLNERTREKSKELQIVYDVNQMKAEHAREAGRMQRIGMIASVVASVVLLVLLTVVFLFWRHTQKLAKELSDANHALGEESANLRRAKDELEKARDEARLANRVKSDFIKNMSGEIAVPLHAINEYTNLIIDCSEAGFKPYLKHFADLVSLNAELLTSIVNDVLNLSEIDSDAVAVKMKSESLLKMCNMAVESVMHRVSPGVKMEVQNGLSDIMVYTDPRRLLQILMQLLVNAAKFTDKGIIILSFYADKDGRNAVISVTDTGIGISPENSERIFERFVKLDRSSQGIGIGLSIARHLAELIGGTITLDASYADGARFVVTVPLG